jgi:hypothetical protein
MPKIIHNWEELSECESETHILEIKDGCGWIHPKNDLEFKNWNGHHYLSTHTFYGKTYEESTKILQSCGFDIIIDDWDK